MPTPNGVNYLLQFLIDCRLIPQLSNNKNQKWTFSLMSYYLLFVHWRIGFVELMYCILSKCQRLRHFKTQTECTEDSKEHACTWLNTTILDTRDIRLVGTQTLGEFLLGNLLTLTCVADNLPHTIGVCLLAKGLAFRRSHLSEAFVHHGVNAHYVIFFLHNILFLIVLPCLFPFRVSSASSFGSR